MNEHLATTCCGGVRPPCCNGPCLSCFNSSFVSITRLTFGFRFFFVIIIPFTQEPTTGDGCESVAWQPAKGLNRLPLLTVSFSSLLLPRIAHSGSRSLGVLHMLIADFMCDPFLTIFQPHDNVAVCFG